MTPLGSQSRRVQPPTTAKELIERAFSPSLNDALVTLSKIVLQLRQPDHQPDQQTRATRCACACPPHPQGRTEPLQAFQTPLAILEGGRKYATSAKSIPPTTGGSTKRQRVTQIDHRVQPSAERSQVHHRNLHPNLPARKCDRTRTWRIRQDLTSPRPEREKGRKGCSAQLTTGLHASRQDIWYHNRLADFTLKRNHGKQTNK